MRKRWLLWLLGAVLLYLIGVGAAMFLSLTKAPNLFSSPTELRDSPAFESGNLGVLKPARRSPMNDWPAVAAMSEPRKIPGVGSQFLLEWEGEPELKKENLPERWAAGLEGDDGLELVAFASWTPQPDDDVSEGADWQAKPVFRDAGTLAVLSVEDLDALGIPETFRSMTPPKRYRTPKLRLLFRTKNMEYVHFTGGEGGDVNTGAVVTYDLSDLSEKEPMSASIGEWTRMDLALLIWHDAPIRLHLQVLTGEPQFAELEQKIGAQVVFGDQLRIQWLGTVDGDVDVGRNPESFTPGPAVPESSIGSLVDRLSSESGRKRMAQITLDKDDWEKGPVPLLRESSAGYLSHHCGWINHPDGKTQWDWSFEGDSGQIKLATSDAMPPPGEAMKLVFLPKITEMTFELAGLPDQPNPRTVEDLFDVRIPRLTVPEDPESAEDHLIGFISVCTEMEWELTNLWDDALPAEMPDDRTFRNQTPQELLDWYMKVTPGAKIRCNEGAKVIHINEERESLWDRFKDRLSGIRVLVLTRRGRFGNHESQTGFGGRSDRGDPKKERD